MSSGSVDRTSKGRVGHRWLAGLLGPLGLTVVLAGCSAGSQIAQQDGQQSVRGFTESGEQLVLLDAVDRLPVPDVSGMSIEGKPLAIADFLGQVVIVNIWASWCGPCREEAPALRAVWQDTKGKGVQFLGLVTRDSQVAAQQFAARYGLGYPHLMDADGSLQLELRDSVPAMAIPSTLVIDKQGRVAGRAIGKVSESSLRGFIEPLLTENSQASNRPRPQNTTTGK